MRLLEKTYRSAFIFLIPFSILGVIMSYFIMEHVNYEEMDEYLLNEMNHLQDYHAKYGVLPRFPHNMSRMTYNTAPIEPMFKDTLILETFDNEWIPHRELHFTLEHEGNHHYLVLQHALLGKDDVFEGSLIIAFGFVILGILLILATLKYTASKIWNPFTKTLKKLSQFDLTKPLPVFQNTDIEEFKELNSTVSRLLKKLKDDYEHTAEFNENASHELQTHLSIIRSSHEKLLNTIPHEQKEELREISKAHKATLKLSKIQTSLLLLSKIRNQEFRQQIAVDLAPILMDSLSHFEEIINLRNIQLTQTISSCVIQADQGLMETLIINLVKNAIRHNVVNGYLEVSLDEQHLMVRNSGKPLTQSPNSMLGRFAKAGKTGNLGIGLSIVKEICDLYNFTLAYQNVADEHRLEVFLKK